MSKSRKTPPASLISDHRRQWRNCRYVYPVISRRSRGLSIGVNLNPDKRCNFSCVYCQINRRIHRGFTDVDLPTLRQELQSVVSEAADGRLWRQERFAETPEQLRRVNDIAFSGDGEPTCLSNFDQAVEIAAGIKAGAGLDDVKIVIITNATQFTSEQFSRALPILDANNGEIWAKLDAGTADYFRRVNRPHRGITLESIVAGITKVAIDRPVVIQSLFLRMDGFGPSDDEISAYCRRLGEILSGGGRIKLVQIHTIARPPESARASAMGDKELDAIAATVRGAVAPVPVEVFYGCDVPPQAK